jgi:hypothetical protein
MTFSITTLSIMGFFATLSIMTLSIMTLNIMTLSKMTLSTMTLSINEAQQKWHSENDTQYRVSLC